MKRRGVCLAVALSAIPIGLIARALRSDADATTFSGFIATYLGDTLWAVMFFFLFAAALIRWPAWRLFLLALCFTVGIETSQLYRGEPLATLRGFPPTGFLLGNHFLWSDVICLAVGSALAVGLHHLIARPSKSA
ncbi:MAG: DUF2809 domain-containing protein [Phycisphaeraceae bacterium]|nr:DUF2809 domain-containing protein [Phycisphaeraceae bacterium]